MEPIDLFEAQQEGGQKYIFSLFYCRHCAYTETGWKGGRGCKWFIFGGPSRSRTYGPLIKSKAGGLFKSLMHRAIPSLYYTVRC